MKKKIFSSKKKNNKIYFFLIIFIFFTFIYLNASKSFFSIPFYKKSFYIIPIDKGGKKIANLDKKSLNYSKIDDKSLLNEYNNPVFSIQLFASSNYDLIEKKYAFFKKFNTLNAQDLYILSFENYTGIDFILLYKNFKKRDLALNYCHKYLNFLINCVVINAQNINNHGAESL